jgi:hypothetical protein
MVCTFKIDPSFLDTAPQNCADRIEEGSRLQINARELPVVSPIKETLDRRLQTFDSLMA